MTISADPLRERSEALGRAAATLTPGGVHSNVRLAAPRIFFERGKGAWLWDVDGNDYVDYLLGQGPNFLGHAPDDITAEVTDAVRGGMIYGGQHPLEIEAAELFLDAVGWAQVVRFGLSGTEAVQVALRVARAATGRSAFIRFEGQYHGWLDNVLVAGDGPRPQPASSGQLAGHLEDSIQVPWNDADAFRDAVSRNASRVAAVIMEPMMCNQGAISPMPGYLEEVRRLCTENGIVLIFDEVITGFRLALGGAAQRFGVTPDLATYGKAMAGGWPVSALAGRADLMAGIGTGEINHSGTFNSSVMSMAAVAATMRRLRDDPPYGRLEEHGTALMSGLTELADRHGIPLRVQGLPMAFHASLGGDPAPFIDYRGLQQRDLAGYAALSRALVRNGVWVAARGIWYVSTAHGDAELAAALERVEVTFGGSW